VPISRLEIRCEEGGGDYELELAKAALRETLSLYLFCRQGCGRSWTYSAADLELAAQNEHAAMKDGLDCRLRHPFTHGQQLTMREFIKETLELLEPFARGIGTYLYLQPLREYAAGEANEAMKAAQNALTEIGREPEKTPSGKKIIPPEIIRAQILSRRDYIMKKLIPNLGLQVNLAPINGHVSFGYEPSAK
jgi:gamma-glutamyl:cysteine ligase YbdK (ATP-grasp superfamily)